MQLTASGPATPPRKHELWTDLGNARRLTREHGKDHRYFAARRTWLAWEGIRWREDERGQIYTRAKQSAEGLWQEAKELDADDTTRQKALGWAAKSQSRQSIESAVALARSEPGIPVTAAELDADPWLLNAPNGVIDLQTGELRPHERGLLMTKMTAAPYESGARSPLWDEMVATVTNGDAELAAYLQRTLGYALYGAWREKAFWFGFGPPDGGKSTFLGAVGDVLGDYHVSASASTWMAQRNGSANRGDVVRLLGARLVTTLEVPQGAQYDAELVKKVTGGDKLVAAAKYEHDIEFKPTFALWFGANDRPIVQDNDDGMWARLCCVPFTNSIPKERQDKRLREKLTSPEHGPAVLAWLVEGCRMWQRDGIGTCRAVEEATADYRRSMNKAADFFDECCELTRDPQDRVTVADLRNVYAGWCESNEVRSPLQPKQLGTRLRQLGVTGGDDASRVNGERTWRGIRLRADLPPEATWPS